MTLGKNWTASTLIYRQIKQSDSLQFQFVSRKSDRQEKEIINKEIFYTEWS